MFPPGKNGTIWSLCPTETNYRQETSSTADNHSQGRKSTISNEQPSILSVDNLCTGTNFCDKKEQINVYTKEEDESGPDWFRSMNPGMDGILNNEVSDAVDVFAFANLTTENKNDPFKENKLKNVLPKPKNDQSSHSGSEVFPHDWDKSFNMKSEDLLNEVIRREKIYDTKWKNIITNLCEVIVNKIKIDVRNGDSINISDYIHVKKLFVNIDTPHTEIIWGTSCSKSLLFGESFRDPEPSNESVMLVAGSIEYDKVSSKLSALEPIILQEENYLEKQIDRISSKRASLILVEGGVSRIAAKLLQNKGIKAAINMKSSALNRISRCVDTQIVSYSDAQLTEQKLGFCPDFYQKRISLKDGSFKSILVFSDSRKYDGCSILLYGNDMEELRAVKRVILFMATITYSNKLEKMFLKAFNLSVSSKPSECLTCDKRSEVLKKSAEKTDFEKQLETSVLSSSPLIEFEPPYLETIDGRKSPLLCYFKQPIFKLFKEEDYALFKESNNTTVNRNLSKNLNHGLCLNKRGLVLPEIITAFRAMNNIAFRKHVKNKIECSNSQDIQKDNKKMRLNDVMDPRAHQTLAVLFGSFSPKSPNAPYFCVRPWVVSMKYYEDHDMTMGQFLTKYCFNKNYECPSSNCDISMLEHLRKIVFGRVCVEIISQTVNDYEPRQTVDNEIIFWRNCTKCNFSSKMERFDKELWNFSFAKFLNYIGYSHYAIDEATNNAQNKCNHCFFHEKNYSFSLGNLVTTFKVTSISPYMVVFSPIICNVKVFKINRKEIGEDIKRLSKLTVDICNDIKEQHEKLDMELKNHVNVTEAVATVDGAIEFSEYCSNLSESILSIDDEYMLSNEPTYKKAINSFMKLRESTYLLIMRWNETIEILKKSFDRIDKVTQSIENPFPTYLHLSIKLQSNIGVVVRDIQDHRGEYKPDIGSIISYALSSLTYDTSEPLKESASTNSQQFNDGENLASPLHLEVEFQDDSASYYVKSFYAEKFKKLRELLIPEGEEAFIRSLSNSTFWTPQGGKSGSFFYRTKDDRFVVKQMSRFEIQSFLKFAPNYFEYLTTAATENKLTTLCKVYGVYRIGYKSKSASLKVDILVMEYLFYNHNVNQVWDLKGSLRNRMASKGKNTSEMVLLDENFVKDLWNQQLYLLPHSKALLNQAISNDSHFLSSQYIMDYSLLVGVDEDNGELIIGIVDYMRTYTLDKKLESWVKIVAIPGAHLPTILSPEMYCARFSEAIDSYFPVVPDQWTGLGTITSC